MLNELLWKYFWFILKIPYHRLQYTRLCGQNFNLDETDQGFESDGEAWKL